MTKGASTGAPAQTYDRHLLFAVLLLVGIGIVMVYSASSALALKKYGSSFHFLKKQALFSLIGMVVLVVFSHIPFRVYRSLTYPVLLTSLGLLVAVLVSGAGPVSLAGSKPLSRISSSDDHQPSVVSLSWVPV